jgi:hypothetical protein
LEAVAQKLNIFAIDEGIDCRDNVEVKGVDEKWAIQYQVY